MDLIVDSFCSWGCCRSRLFLTRAQHGKGWQPYVQWAKRNSVLQCHLPCARKVLEDSSFDSCYVNVVCIICHANTRDSPHSGASSPHSQVDVDEFLWEGETVLDHFWKLRCRKSARRCGPKHISKSKCTKHYMFAPLLEVQMSSCVAGAKDCAPCQKWAKRDGFAAFPETMAGVGHLKRIFKDAFRVAGAVTKDHVHQRCSEVRALISWEGLHFGVSDLQVCWDDFAWQVQHFVWPGINFSWQAQYFTQVEWKNRKMHWYEAPSAALNFPFLKEVSQNCFVFDVDKNKHWGSLAELLRFWTLLGWINKRSVAELFCFWCC